MDLGDRAISHLYQSIMKLDPSDPIDAKIIARVSSSQSDANQHNSIWRQMISA